MRRTAGFVAAAVCLAVGPVGAAGADTRVTNDSTPDSYTRYDA